MVRCSLVVPESITMLKFLSSHLHRPCPLRSCALGATPIIDPIQVAFFGDFIP